MLAIAFALIVEFSVVLCVFLALSATPLERLKLGRIVPLLAAATFLLLVGIFGLLPGFLAAPLLGRLLVASGVVIALVAGLEVSTVIRKRRILDSVEKVARGLLGFEELAA